MQNGMVQIYIGDGKGKTTASFGLAMRCYGCGGKVLVLQFLKTSDTGELETVHCLDDARFQVRRFESEHDLVFDDATELDLEYLKKDIQKAIAYASEAVHCGDWDLIVLDEVLWALHFGFITEQQVHHLLDERSAQTELVLTGRNAPETILDRADYITNMQAKRHPYEKGIYARKGIEF